MNEEINTGPSPEEKRLQELDDAEWVEINFNMHPEPIISQENLREAGPEIKEFEAMIALFESMHNLSDLLSIINLTPAEALIHPIRKPATIELTPIVTLLNKLEKETNISTEKHEELKAKYKHLSRAVGMISGGKVDHNR